MDTYFISPYILSLAMISMVSQVDPGRMKQVEQLSPEQIARAWQDPVYRKSLTSEQKRMLPANPAGEISAALASKMPLGCETETMLMTHATCTYIGCHPLTR